jgi:hypothetical protein
VTFLKPDYTPIDQSQLGFNLLWQAGRRDPLTGVYIGGDGAYHERLGKSLNPEVGMAQGESDFAKNYQRAIDTADPATFALLQPPSRELGWLAEAAVFVGSVAIGIGVSVLTANPLLGAMAAGAASSLFDYGIRGLLNGEQLSWSGAFQSAALGSAIGAGTLGAFKLAAFGARLIGKAAPLVYRGGKALFSVSVPQSAGASAPGARVSIGGVAATELPGRLSPAQLAAMQRASSTEFAQVYVTGPGKNGGGGVYYLIQGTDRTVQVPIGPNVRWINHTHPEMLDGGIVPLRPSGPDRNVLRLLEDAGSPQRTSQIVPEVGEPFNFKRR